MSWFRPSKPSDPGLQSKIADLERRMRWNQADIEFAAALAHVERKKRKYGDNWYKVSDAEFDKVDTGPKSEAEVFLEEMKRIQERR
jgi:hypothetical protein